MSGQPRRAIALRRKTVVSVATIERWLTVEPLTAQAFAPFGEVIEIPETGGIDANAGTAVRFDDFTKLELDRDGGHAVLSVFRVTPARLPFACRSLERHPLSTQAFMPLSERRFLVIVAPAGGDAPDPAQIRAFLTNGRQGVNYRRAVWHHPVLALDTATDFVVLGRSVDERDCDVVALKGGVVLTIATLPA
ncbi:MAG: ureidoglycolate lyase [Rhodospirillales bacterium]|nr:ureidoglycolate lyase [Rhodospirillales bacterium]